MPKSGHDDNPDHISGLTKRFQLTSINPDPRVIIYPSTEPAMKRLLFAALFILFFPFAAVADAPKTTYSNEESATILTAATVVGALAFCDERGIHKNKVYERLYYKLAAHMAPHAEDPGDSGTTSRASYQFLKLAYSSGRAALIQYDVTMSKFGPAQVIEMRSENECRTVERMALRLMEKGALFDNDVAIPGEVGA
jgi:hypothetical protein